MIKVHQHALINQILYKKRQNNLLPNDVLVRPTEKVGRMIFYKKLCKVDPLQFWMMYYSYFYEQKLLQVVSILKNAIDCAGASMLLSAQTTDAAHIYLGLTLKHCYMLELF